MSKNYKFETIQVHAGQEAPDPATDARAVPIYATTSYVFKDSATAAGRFGLTVPGNIYTRLMNPTSSVFEERIAALEGGTAAMLTSSGQAANFFAVFNICTCGDHFIASSSIYGGTFNLFGVSMAKMGIECTFVDQDLPLEELQKYVKPNTKCVFAETLVNPTVNVLDFEKFAALAHNNGVPLIIDNTFATPVNCRPFEFGADIVTHSTTKYMDGHGVSVGGAIVDSGNFDWMAHAEKFPGLCTPDDSYHGLTYATKFGKAGYITKATAQLMRDFGSIQSPQNAFYLNLGLESLHVRMERHCSNALKVAKYLETNEKIAWVSYPDLETVRTKVLKAFNDKLAEDFGGEPEWLIELNDDAKLALHNLAKVLNRNPELKLSIEGHTSSEGTEAVNQKLSEDRAQAAVDFLVNKEGIDASRLQAKGFGSSKPISEDDLEVNRRTEFVILGYLK